MLIFTLNFLSALAALGAAYFWWDSTKVEIPKEFGIALTRDENLLDEVTSEQQWAIETSKRNSRGALCAAIAAALMAASTLISLDWNCLL